MRLDELADDLLRCALRARHCGVAPNGPVGDAIRRTCGAAHEHDLRVEEVLVVLKNRWRNLPEATQVARPLSEAVFARVITWCIQEYYAPRCDR